MKKRAELMVKGLFDPQVSLIQAHHTIHLRYNKEMDAWKMKMEKEGVLEQITNLAAKKASLKKQSKTD